MSELLAAADVCVAAGISYRRLDFWVRSGAVVPSLAEADGSGTRRGWSADDVLMLAAIVKVAADLYDLGFEGVPIVLVRRLWMGLREHRYVTLTTPSATISTALPET